VILHALTDLSQSIGTNGQTAVDVQNTNVNAVSSILSILPSLVILLGLTLFLLRRSKMEAIVSTNQDDFV
jgi:hypothetical protein